MKRYVTDFSLFGTRRYVHSTSFMHYLTRIFTGDKISSCQAVFRKKLYSNAEVYIEEGRKSSIPNCNAELLLSVEGNSYIVSFKAIDKEIAKSVPYDEEALVGSARVDSDGREITVNEAASENLINIIVAANKKLLLAILPNEGWSRWSVGKWDLKWSEMVRALGTGAMKIRLKNVLNEQYARSEIYIGKARYGTIDYARERLT